MTIVEIPSRMAIPQVADVSKRIDAADIRRKNLCTRIRA
jgi:hypothetical protein